MLFLSFTLTDEKGLAMSLGGFTLVNFLDKFVYIPESLTGGHVTVVLVSQDLVYIVVIYSLFRLFSFEFFAIEYIIDQFVVADVLAHGMLQLIQFSFLLPPTMVILIITTVYLLLDLQRLRVNFFRSNVAK
jgi:hypothetical protein